MSRERYTYSYATGSNRSWMSRAAVLLLLLSGILLLIMVRMNHPIATSLHAHLLNITRPMLMIIASPVEKFSVLVEEKNQIMDTYRDNKKLRAENDTLRRWQEVAQVLKAENESLRTLAGYQPIDRANYVTARVIGQSPGTYSASVILNVGSDAGIKRFQPVIDAHGLMGRINELSETTAQVLLLSDASSRVPVITGNSRQHAILAGTGDALLRLTFIGGDPENIEVGEPVVTTEEGNLIPGGILIGSVLKRDGETIFVKPLRPLAQTEYARIIVTK
jgi:rod shape-determining protein MreC